MPSGEVAVGIVYHGVLDRESGIGVWIKDTLQPAEFEASITAASEAAAFPLLHRLPGLPTVGGLI